jgi:hypothetical protein
MIQIMEFEMLHLKQMWSIGMTPTITLPTKAYKI